MCSGQLATNTTSLGHTIALDINDVPIDSHTHLLTLIKLFTYATLKTDQFGAGNFLHLGRTFNVLCPVALMLTYLVQR